MPEQPMMQITNLVSSYGNIKALKGVTMEVAKGEIVAILGANGAGKSTLMKSILGMVHIESGSILYAGEELVGKKSHQIIPKGISLVPEGRKIFVDVSVRDNLEIGEFFRPKDKALDEKLWKLVFDLFPRLYERRKQLGGTLSGGEQQMLAVGRALMSNPRFLMLDEPSMGLAPLVVQQVFEIIAQIRREMGTTILLVEQNANMALGVCDRAYLLNTGEITDTGTSKELLANERLIEAYLGVKKSAD